MSKQRYTQSPRVSLDKQKEIELSGFNKGGTCEVSKFTQDLGSFLNLILARGALLAIRKEIITRIRGFAFHFFKEKRFIMADDFRHLLHKAADNSNVPVSLDRRYLKVQNESKRLSITTPV